MLNRTMPWLTHVTDPEVGGGGEPEVAKTFTQDDVNKIVDERLKRERDATAKKYADYEDLKAKASASATAEERIAALEAQVKSSEHEALRRRVQAAHGITDEDAELFLTGPDEQSLTAQAKRLAERAPAKGGPVARKEGGNADTTKPGASDLREFTRNLFGSAKTT